VGTRRERRGARGGEGQRIVNISFGRGGLFEGVEEVCFACGRPAPAWPWSDGKMAHGVVYVQGPGVHRQELICEGCFADGDTAGTMIMRKIYGAPNMAVRKGGEATPEQIQDIADALAEAEGKQKN
jgi:hypothetical protein